MEVSLHILLVEDDADSLLALSRLLEASGHRVCRAETMTTALTEAQSHHFDLVIADLSLPDGSGLNLMRQLQDRDPMPGIAMTGYDDVEASRAAGFDAHLTKPISFQDLVETIHRLTGGDRPSRLAS